MSLPRLGHAWKFVSWLSSGGGSAPPCAVPGSPRFAVLGTGLLWVLGTTRHPLGTCGEGLALLRRDAFSRSEIKVRPQRPLGGRSKPTFKGTKLGKPRRSPVLDRTHGPARAQLAPALSPS